MKKVTKIETETIKNNPMVVFVENGDMLVETKMGIGTVKSVDSSFKLKNDSREVVFAINGKEFKTAIIKNAVEINALFSSNKKNAELVTLESYIDGLTENNLGRAFEINGTIYSYKYSN